MREMDDPIIGHLTFERREMDHWVKSDRLDLIGADIPLSIQSDENGPNEQQRQKYLSLKHAPADMRSELQDALFAFYKEQRELYASANADSEEYIEECLPILTSSDQIWAILEPADWYILGPDSSICMFDVPEDRCDTAIFWYGCWDIEHEFGALYKDGRLQRVAAPGDF
jgi:hypothetical protein